MSFADQLLIGWWVAAIVIVTALFARFRLYGRINWLQQPNMSRGGRFFIIAIIYSLPFSFFPLLSWTSNETRLSVVNMQIFLLLFGAALVCLAALVMFGPKPQSRGIKAWAVFLFLVGMIPLTFGAFMLVPDIFYSWRIFEGRVESHDTWRRRFMTYHWVTIDGRKLEATNEIYKGLKVGDRVRVEIAPGSNMIFRAEQVTQR